MEYTYALFCLASQKVLTNHLQGQKDHLITVQLKCGLFPNLCN